MGGCRRRFPTSSTSRLGKWRAWPGSSPTCCASGRRSFPRSSRARARPGSDTIAGAKQKLKSEHHGKKAQTALPLTGGQERELLRKVRAELDAIAELLERR